MTDFWQILILAGALVVVTAMVAGAALRAWRQWLDFKRLELRARVPGTRDDTPEEESPAALIELASIRERLRRLEAIANGVEL